MCDQYEGQPAEFLQLRAESIEFGELWVEFNDICSRLEKISIKKRYEADKYFDDELYWEKMLIKYPNSVRVKCSSGSYLLGIEDYENDRAFWDAKGEVIGYGR